MDDDQSALRRSDLKPGDQVDREGASVEVPLPGDGVITEAIFMDGHTTLLRVETSDDGTVWESLESPLVSHDPTEVEPSDEDSIEEELGEEEDLATPIEPDEAEAPDEESDAAIADAAVVSSAASSSRPACRDTAYKLMGFKWASTYKWSFNSGSTPSYLAKASAEKAIHRAINGIAISRNDCNLRDRVSVKQSYEGRTSRGTQIRSNGTCAASDGHNVVAFGALPSGHLAVACTWFQNGRAVSSDIKLNNRYTWYTKKPSNCRNRFSVHAVTTHEAGHTFGLGHVSESRHGNLTMSTRITACSSAAYTLGRGDVRGLRKLY